MNKLFWVYTVAAILAFNSSFAVAGTQKSAGAKSKQDVRQLLQRSEKASFEEIAELQSKLDRIRRELKNERIDVETSMHIGRIQNRIDQLVNKLVTAMK